MTNKEADFTFRKSDKHNVPISPNATVVDTLEGLHPDHKILRAGLAPGEYFHRMARPLFWSAHANEYYCPDWNENFVTSFRNQLKHLTEQLAVVCHVVEPTEASLSVYGHAICDLLINACTEVEAHWVGVLEAHGQGPKGNYFDVVDYVRLSDPMKLPEYGVKYRNWPSLPLFRPFAQWRSDGNATQDTAWYDAYNAVKHNRQQNLDRATLNAALNAVCACAIMQFASFGDNGFKPSDL